jgi:hypothetical protein
LNTHRIRATSPAQKSPAKGARITENQLLLPSGFSPSTAAVRADRKATFRPTGCSSWSVPSHSAGGTRCRERLRNHLVPLRTAGKVEGVLAEIDRCLLPLPRFMGVTSPPRDAAVIARRLAARELIDPALTAVSAAMEVSDLCQIRGTTRRLRRPFRGECESMSLGAADVSNRVDRSVCRLRT